MKLLRNSWLWGAVVAVLPLLAGLLFVQQTKQQIFQQLLVEMKAAQSAGEIPADANLEMIAADASDFGMQIPPEMLWRVQLSDLLVAFWWIGVLICLGLGFLVGVLLARPDQVRETEREPNSEVA